MKITKEQEETLNALACNRIQPADNSLLANVKPQIINGRRTNIVDLFRSRQELCANAQNEVASYVVMHEELVFLFFSLRCGELFRKSISKDVQKLAERVLKASRLYSRNGDRQSYLQTMILVYEEARHQEISKEELEAVVNYKNEYSSESESETVKDIQRVYMTFPAIELKLFGKNADDEVKKNWATMGMPRKMGETLFWKFVMAKVQEAIRLVGAKYLYLFAADNSADKYLISYYKENLHFDCEQQLAASKPSFDFNCSLHFQSINELNARREEFFNTFNPEPAPDAV